MLCMYKRPHLAKTLCISIFNSPCHASYKNSRYYEKNLFKSMNIRFLSTVMYINIFVIIYYIKTFLYEFK